VWRRLRRHLARYPSAVVSSVGVDGYPVSFRCRPRPDRTTRTLVLDAVPPGLDLREGRAGLLCHRHNEALWRLRSFIARGELVRDGDGWVFVPDGFTPGMGLDPLSMVRMIRNGQRTATAYLERRGWERPPIDWGAIEELKREVFG
jgi:hypothetical protein